MNETRIQPRWPWADVAALLALAALSLAFFSKIALTNRVLAGLDIFAYFYPYRDFASEALRSGHLPLWNPYLFMGAPLLANSQVAVLYPLFWPLLWLSAPKQMAWSIVLHIWLAGAGTYLLARHTVRLRPPAAFAAGLIFSLGGFLGAQVEHVNQLNASIWLPWLLLCLEGTAGQGRGRWLALLAGGAVVGLALLAGHTQAAYIVLFGAGVYVLLKGLGDLVRQRWWAGLKGLVYLAAMSAMGALLAAGQLLPTLELAGHSVRSGGLPYNEAASFSLKPTLIFKAFLPPFIWEPPFSEYVAYVGLLGLALALLGAWAVARRKRPGGEILGLALVGAFLAFGAYNPVYYLLYKLIPGFALFRAPARWLLLYSFGAALLAGIGLQTLPRLLDSLKSRRSPNDAPEGSPDNALRGSPDPRSNQPDKPAQTTTHPTLPWQTAIVLLLILELFLAGRRLAYNRPTAPAAFDSLRTAPSHLLADQASHSPGQPFRFLSMSDIGYDPGDMGDLQAMYADTLPPEAIYDLIVATKMKEVLAYNLPLRYRLFSVDGYDGGLLPIESYVTLERLFLDEDEIWPDGRLRQQLHQVPPARLLSLLNVKYVITDKTQDVWIDDVFYDLEHTVPLGQTTLSDLPDFEATHLGIVSHLSGAASLEDGEPVAQLAITGTHGTVITRTLRAGEHTAEGLYDRGNIVHRQARVGHRWHDEQSDGEGAGSDYIVVLDLGASPLRPQAITIRSLLPDGQFRLRGMSLIDEATGTSRNLSVDPAYRLVHSGDVKVYQNLDVQDRAFVVHHAREVADDAQALTLLADPGFDPAKVVLLHGDKSGELAHDQGASRVEILSYEPEQVHLRATLDQPGWLVLADADYPGWVATVNGEPREIRRANLYFRAVALDVGSHQVVFRYQPSAARLGLAASLVGWILWLLAVTVALLHHIGRKSPSSV